MSHFIKIFWSIVDTNGNSVDNVRYKSEEEARKIMNKLKETDPNITVVSNQTQKIIF